MKKGVENGTNAMERNTRTPCLFVYSFFIEGKSTSVTSTAFQVGPHYTENNNAPYSFRVRIRVRD